MMPAQKRGAMTREQFDDAPAKRRFDNMGDEGFAGKVGDVDFVFLCKRMLWRHH